MSADPARRLPNLASDLPAWVVRRPTSADVKAVHRLTHDVDVAVLRSSDITPEDVAADLADSADLDPRVGRPREQLLVVDGDRVLLWAWAESRCSGRRPRRRTASSTFQPWPYDVQPAAAEWRRRSCTTRSRLP